MAEMLTIERATLRPTARMLARPLVDVVLVGMNESAWCDGILDDRLDRCLLHVGQHLQHDLSTTLDQPEDRRLVLLLRAPPGIPFSLRRRPGRPFLRPRPVGPCARPQRRLRRSRLRRSASRALSAPPGHGADAR